MKKLLIILAAIISNAAISQQVNPTGTVSTLSVTPGQICVCDSVKVSFVYRRTATLFSPTNFTVFAKVNNIYRNMAVFSYVEIFKMNKVPVGNFYNDTTYSFKLKIPCNSLDGLGASALFNFTLQDGNFIPVLVKDCTVGIEEYNKDSATPIYYDFYGRITEPKQGEWLIRQIGTSRVTVLIQ